MQVREPERAKVPGQGLAQEPARELGQEREHWWDGHRKVRTSGFTFHLCYEFGELDKDVTKHLGCGIVSLQRRELRYKVGING